MVLNIIARILGAITSLYMILCTIRVYISWVPGINTGRVGYYLSRIVDPYLGLFSRIRVFRTERFDFSPIAALAVLSVANNVFSTLAFAGRISVGFFLNLILDAGWSAVSFVLSFMAVCALIRIIVFVARWNSLHPLWVVLDSILNPVLYRINRIIYRNRAIEYLKGLITGFIVLILLRAAGGALISVLGSWLISLPF